MRDFKKGTKFQVYSSCSARNHRDWNIEHNKLQTYVRSYNAVSMSRHSGAETKMIYQIDLKLLTHNHKCIHTYYHPHTHC